MAETWNGAYGGARQMRDSLRRDRNIEARIFCGTANEYFPMFFLQDVTSGIAQTGVEYMRKRLREYDLPSHRKDRQAKVCCLGKGA